MSGFTNQQGWSPGDPQNCGNWEPDLKELTCRPAYPEIQCRSNSVESARTLSEGESVTNPKADARKAGTSSNFLQEGKHWWVPFCNLLLTCWWQSWQAPFLALSLQPASSGGRVPHPGPSMQLLQPHHRHKGTQPARGVPPLPSTRLQRQGILHFQAPQIISHTRTHLQDWERYLSLLIHINKHRESGKMTR